MNPDLLLSVVAAFAGFVLKTTVAFGVCLLLSRLVDSANPRFMIWSGFLFGGAAYWVFLAKSVLTLGPSVPGAPRGSFQPAASTVGAWQIPDSWAFPLGLTLRGAGIVYAFVLIYMLLIHLRKRRHLKWVLRFTSEPPVEITQDFQSLAKSLHVGRSRLLILSGATSPATFGWIRPTILLPTSCLEQDRSELQDILRHELHHVRRLDSVWNGLAMACRALLFFHPAAWYAVRKMQFDRELACDWAVVSQSPSRKGRYAECLVRFARLNLIQDAQPWGIDFAASDELAARVHSILAGSRRAPRWLLWLRTASGLTLSALFIGVVPSLAVLLSYAHRPGAQPLTATLLASPPAAGSGIRATRRGHGLPSEVNKAADVTDVSASVRQDAQPALESPADRKAEISPSLQSASGPQLLHRRPGSTPGNNGAKSQSVDLIDSDGAGQTGKPGDHDRKQTLQQTATAAFGIYKRASEVDRH